MGALVFYLFVMVVTAFVAGLIAETNRNWWGFIVLAVFAGVAALSVHWSIEAQKRECEAELPRNVECAWAAPQEPPHE